MIKALRRRGRWLTFALAIALVLPTIAPSPAMAAGTFEGGPDQDPTIRVLNDHTPYAVHFSATGLDPDTIYYVKVRFTEGLSPSGQTNRGWTWNPVSMQWIQEREPLWSEFPTVTSDGSGVITSNAGWVWTKFGDERRTGPYYLSVALNASGGAHTGTTSNNTTPTVVSVLDARSEGSWYHNGTASGAQAAKRAEVTSFDTTTTVYSLSKTETNTVDDDSNATVDDEDYGPAGKAGDWRLGVPAATTADVFLNRVKKFNDVITPPADTEIALGAADASAPTSPTALSATPDTRKIVLNWSASTDNNAVTSYRIYRWAETSATAYTTPLHEFIATTAGTSYEDVSPALGGTAWSYEVRAVDTSGNISPRSDSAVASALLPTVNADVTPATPDGLGGWYMTTPEIELTGVGTTGIEYSWDSATGPWTPYLAELTAPEGASTLYYRGFDSIGPGNVASLDLSVDSHAPASPTLTTPAVASSASPPRPFRVSWLGVDPSPGSGTALYQLQTIRRPGYSSTLMTTAGTATPFSGTIGSTYMFRVRARDTAGSWGAWSAFKTTTIPYNESSASYRRTWSTVKSSSCWLGTAKATRAKNASVAFAFRGGKSVGLVLIKGPGRGRAAVYVDGKYVKTIDTYSSTWKMRSYVGVKSLTGSGSHTVRVVNLATTGRPRFDIDGFAVTR